MCISKLLMPINTHKILCDNLWCQKSCHDNLCSPNMILWKVMMWNHFLEPMFLFLFFNVAKVVIINNKTFKPQLATNNTSQEISLKIFLYYTYILEPRINILWFIFNSKFWQIQVIFFKENVCWCCQPICFSPNGEI